MQHLLVPVYFVLTVFMWSGGMVFLLLGACVGFVLTPFISQHQRFKYIFAPCMGIGVRLTFSRIRVIYDPKLDRERRSVFCQTHVNILDGQLACIPIPHEFCGLHSHWQTLVPGYGWILKLTHGIPVFPNATNRTALITEQARDRLARNISILAYPEGHRTRTGQVGPFKKGSFYMARDAGYPVVPLCVRGMFEVNKPKHKLFRPGNVQIYVGRQMETAGLTDEGIADLAERMRQVHVDWVERGFTPEQMQAAAA